MAQRTTPTNHPTDTTRAVLYARCSTARQTESGLGIAAQRMATTSYARAFSWDVVSDLDENGVSGMMAPDERPVLGQALADLDEGRADVLVASHLSRIGRDTADILDLAERAERAGWALVVLDLNLDTSSPPGRLMLTMLAAIARFERDQIAQRTRQALAQLKRGGARLGRPVEQSVEARALAQQWRDEGMSYQAIADRLTEGGLTTARGGKWHASTARRLVVSAELDRQAARAARATSDGQA